MLKKDDPRLEYGGLSGGGYLKEIPKPHVRMFPNEKSKRRVSVAVMVYDLVGGRHYRVSVTEEDNPIWNSHTQAEHSPNWKEIQGTEYGKKVVGWQVAWDDEEGKGLELYSVGLDFLYQVEDFIRDAWENNFSDETHYLSHTTSSGPITVEYLMKHWRELYKDIETLNHYIYSREGD
jgi:hypothetical protein